MELKELYLEMKEHRKMLTNIQMKLVKLEQYVSDQEELKESHEELKEKHEKLAEKVSKVHGFFMIGGWLVGLVATATSILSKVFHF